MACFNEVYTQKLNRKHKKGCHIFQGRFKAILVEGNFYLLEILLYVLPNPVRASMLADPGKWIWSNYCSTSGFSERPGWLNISWVLGCFGDYVVKTRQGYVTFVHQGMKWRKWDPSTNTFFQIKNLSRILSKR